MRRVLLVLALLFAAPGAVAIGPDEILPDKALEGRAREIGRELRCLVCQNQSIDDSEADLARDLRILVRERLVAGDSDAAVKDYVVARFGDYVLLRPPFKATTVLLWLGPGLILLAGLFAAWRFYRRPGPPYEAPPVELTADEQRRVASLLGDDRSA